MRLFHLELTRRRPLLAWTAEESTGEDCGGLIRQRRGFSRRHRYPNIFDDRAVCNVLKNEVCNILAYR
jgi:hypothetical protein